MGDCSRCGHENTHDAAFCGSCGSPTAEPPPPPPPPPPSPVAPGPAQGPVVTQAVTGTAPGKPRRGAVVALLIAALLLLGIAVAVWMLFFRPMSPVDYEDAVVDQLYDLRDGLMLVFDGVDGLYWLSDSSLGPDDHARFVEDTEEGLTMIRAATNELRTLRPPAEYRDAHRRIESFTAYYEDTFVPAIEELQDQVGPGMEEDRLFDVLEGPEDKITRGFGRAFENLERASGDIYVPQELLDSFDW